jgi:peptide/nickel transport system substrate-binding protein
MRLKHLLFAAALLAPGLAQAETLRIGLEDDPDVLDPDQSRTFVGRIVYTALCDKLFDISPELDIVPQLATEWSFSEDGKALTMKLREGVTFHDGEPFNAEAVKANIERSLNLPESRRKSELTSVENVEVVGPYEVRINLKQPDVTLLATLADRAGMMISPKAAEAAGVDFGANPVCSGPFKFEQRVQQDRIVLSKFEDYWNADEIFFDEVVYLPIPDTTVRLANLKSGDLDMIERLAATDVANAEADPGIDVERATSLGYEGMTVNVGNGPRAETPIGQDKRVRQALSAAIDRNALNQVVFGGQFEPGNQSVPPNNPYYASDFPVPERDVERAKQLLEEAGVQTPLTVEVQVPNNPVQMQVMQVIQAMAAEAGFDIQLVAKEFATLLQEQTAGNYTVSQIGWSGRADPDGNIHTFVTCGGGINDSKYCNEEVDRLLNEARTVADPEERKRLYAQAAEILQEDLPIIYLYHEARLYGLDDAIEGFTAHPDGMIRLEGVKRAGS